MLNRRRNQQTPTFLEGTPGLYVKRESPPKVPSTAPIPTKFDVGLSSLSSENRSNASLSLSGSRTSLIHPFLNLNKTTAMGASTPALIASNLYSSATSIATTFGVSGLTTTTPCISEISQHPNTFSSQNFSALQHHQSQFDKSHDIANRRLSHTPVSPNRRAVSRHELSSHSFNNPPSSSRNFAVAVPILASGSSTNILNIDNNNEVVIRRNNLSTDGTNNNNQQQRRHLVSSLSFGNVIENSINDENYEKKNVSVDNHSFAHNIALPNHHSGIVRQHTSISSGSGVIINGLGNEAEFSVSMQSLPESLVVSNTIPSDAGGMISISGDPEADLPLPPNWEVEVTLEGIRYYVDHDHRRTHWIHPLAVENLLPNWIKIFDQVHGVVYFNELEQRSQFEHPGLATPATLQFNTNAQSQYSLLQHRPNYCDKHSIDQTTNFVEDLNIIDNEDVPEWIRLYSQASFESDHLLNWEMFKMSELEEFDQMLMKLFKQDAINTVIKYERPRREINNELTQRKIITA